MSKKKAEMPRREEFLKTALARFSKVGYSATSTREICAEVGLVHSAIYNYFPSKEAVVLAIEAREMEKATRSLLEALEAAGSDPESRLVAALTHIYEAAIAQQQAWRLMADMIRSLKPANKQQVIKRRDEYQKIVFDVLSEANEAKLITAPNLHLATLHVFGLAEGVAGWFRKDGPLKRTETVADIARFALQGLGAAPDVIMRL
ncbi:TetR/AcrR family transcriptional regulator [Bosea sp. (in: a-proteobacteria)]|uniref:TetR/AcrR family transcriptional regulator n=1 Tax=Bosea sp. (in: a-proteobacteria) TaxID=1871050 RepID=UPI00262DDB1C|nr:TetR/AcrR family transcriptional regulator [Bosea sp. (in: a-proteobacteria)]MCO5090905.1 TetR/AcrR family transcriptional regulator [Bosea sp. (in: a-proteobacteria)]